VLKHELFRGAILRVIKIDPHLQMRDRTVTVGIRFTDRAPRVRNNARQSTQDCLGVHCGHSALARLLSPAWVPLSPKFAKPRRNRYFHRSHFVDPVDFPTLGVPCWQHFPRVAGIRDFKPPFH
jgi:hypothetical protein